MVVVLSPAFNGDRCNDGGHVGREYSGCVLVAVVQLINGHDEKIGIGRMGACASVQKFTLVMESRGIKRILLMKMVVVKVEKSKCVSLFQ